MTALVLVAALAAAAPDHLYIYGAPNRSLECPALRLYVDTEGLGSLQASGCATHSIDWQWWPDFPLLDINISVHAVDQKRPLVGRCSFVAHAHEAQASSTVVDCR